MRNGFKVFDADAHVVEPRNLWDRFLDSPYRDRVSWQQPFEGMDRFRPASNKGRSNNLVRMFAEKRNLPRQLFRHPFLSLQRLVNYTH